jgi:hypothetical protein
MPVQQVAINDSDDSVLKEDWSFNDLHACFEHGSTSSHASVPSTLELLLDGHLRDYTLHGCSPLPIFSAYAT